MAKKVIVLALLLLLVAAVATFLGVFFGISKSKPPPENVFFKAAVAADAGKCSEVGRSDVHLHNLKMMKYVNSLKGVGVCCTVETLTAFSVSN